MFVLERRIFEKLELEFLEYLIFGLVNKTWHQRRKSSSANYSYYIEKEKKCTHFQKKKINVLLVL